MINLLPTENLSAVLAEYRRRRLVVFGGLTLGLLLVALVTIAALFYSFQTKRITLAKQLASLKEEKETREFVVLISQWQELEGQIAVLAPQAAKKSVGKTFEALLSRRQPAVTLSRLIYGEENGGLATLEVGGQARFRQDLLNFVADLKASKTFQIVHSPVSNLIKDRNVGFDLRLELAPLIPTP